MACSTDESPSMADLILEQLEHLRGAIGDVQTWYDDGADFEEIDFGDDVQREACAFAWGYLRGAAEMADLTVMNLVNVHGLRLNGEAPNPKHCPRCGHKRSRRCKTGECRHCSRCEHAWLPEAAHG